MNVKRLEKCLKIGGYPRLHTWALAESAYEFIEIHRGDVWRQNIDMAIKFLTKLDYMFGWRNSLDIHDPIIARDFGGESELEKFRLKIRDTIELLESGQITEGKREMREIKNRLFNIFIKKIQDCVKGEDPMEGVSTTTRLAKIMEERL